ncbi:MAG TPA: hypothetical protein VFY45_21600 [Baekduia sp.]|jgi:hypothetical protein|nr:hypothetical protein [Baekduia sp.]
MSDHSHPKLRLIGSGLIAAALLCAACAACAAVVAAIASSLLVAAPAHGEAQGVALTACKGVPKALEARWGSVSVPVDRADPGLGTTASPSRSCRAGTPRGRRSERSSAPAVQVRS